MSSWWRVEDGCCCCGGGCGDGCVGGSGRAVAEDVTVGDVVLKTVTACVGAGCGGTRRQELIDAQKDLILVSVFIQTGRRLASARGFSLLFQLSEPLLLLSSFLLKPLLLSSEYFVLVHGVAAAGLRVGVVCGPAGALLCVLFLSPLGSPVLKPDLKIAKDFRVFIKRRLNGQNVILKTSLSMEAKI